MVESQYEHMSIDGSAIVRQQSGEFTGDMVYHTADGRRWQGLPQGIPVTLATGDMVSSIRYEPRG